MTLPAGTVCDACNNYFAVKVEKPLLESPEIVALRFHEVVSSKKRRVPPLLGTVGPNLPAFVQRYAGGDFMAAISVEPDALPYLMAKKPSVVNLPAPVDSWPTALASRFMAKAALESLAERLLDNPIGMHSLVTDPQLDPIREYGRYGRGKPWPISQRRIYDAKKSWILPTGEVVQRTWESDFLPTPHGEVYFVLAIFGLELCINLLGRDLRGYTAWLHANNHASPLYHGKNS
jgi:hypothetical protein